MIKNRNQYFVNSEINHRDIRQHTNIHQLLHNLTKYQNGTYYLGIKFYIGLHSYVKDVSNNLNGYNSILKDFLYENSFFPSR